MSTDEIRTLDPGSAEPRPRGFDVTQPFPHGLPYVDLYKEKVPLLQTFHHAAASWAARQGYAGRLMSRLPLLGGGARMIAAECGVYKGHALIACAKIAEELRVPITIFGLDSFAGLPPLSSTDLELAPEAAPYRDKPFFADVSLAEVQERCAAADVAASVVLVAGFFTETLAQLPDQRYDFVHIDCDLYEPHLECLEYFYPRVKSGGIIFFDDYHSRDFPMGRKAIDTFFSSLPEQLFHIQYGDDGSNHTKTFVVKF